MMVLDQYTYKILSKHGFDKCVDLQESHWTLDMGEREGERETEREEGSTRTSLVLKQHNNHSQENELLSD